MEMLMHYQRDLNMSKKFATGEGERNVNYLCIQYYDQVLALFYSIKFYHIHLKDDGKRNIVYAAVLLLQH